jgi:hypothetical protein
MKIGVRILCAVAFAFAVCMAAETLTNSSIVDLHKLGLGEAVIVEKIKTSQCNFDTSTDALKKLKEAGIPDSVLAAMISGGGRKSVKEGGDPNDPLAPHATGVYLYQVVDGKPKMIAMSSSSVERVKSGGGWGMAYGATAKSRAVISGLSANLQLNDSRPTFYFYLTEGLESMASSPDQFALCQFELKKDKNERRLVIGKANWGGSSFGVDPKSMREFTSEKVAEGIFKVVPNASLAPGEYAFVLASGGGVSRMYDFGIK